MKHTFWNIKALLTTLLAGLLILGCADIFNPPVKGKPAVKTGSIVLTINGAGSARTILPDNVTFERYEVKITNDDDDDAVVYNETWTGKASETIELLAGDYSLNVKGFVVILGGGGTTTRAGAEATISFTLDTPDQPVNINLLPYETGGQGYFDYREVTFDSAFTTVIIDYEPYNLTVPQRILRGEGSGSHNYIDNPSPGVYDVIFTLGNGTKTVKWVETVHIYRDLVCTFVFHFPALLLEEKTPVEAATEKLIAAVTADNLTNVPYAYFTLAEITGFVTGDLKDITDTISDYYTGLNDTNMAPANLADLKALVDIALIINGHDSEYEYADEEEAKEAIGDLVKNGNTINSFVYWEETETVTFGVGKYTVRLPITIDQADPTDWAGLLITAVEEADWGGITADHFTNAGITGVTIGNLSSIEVHISETVEENVDENGNIFPEDLNDLKALVDIALIYLGWDTEADYKDDPGDFGENPDLIIAGITPLLQNIDESIPELDEVFDVTGEIIIWVGKYAMQWSYGSFWGKWVLTDDYVDEYTSFTEERVSKTDLSRTPQQRYTSVPDDYNAIYNFEEIDSIQHAVTYDSIAIYGCQVGTGGGYGMLESGVHLRIPDYGRYWRQDTNEEVSLPVVAITDYSFGNPGSGDYTLGGITIPESVVSIGSAFGNCGMLTVVNIGKNVRQICNEAFNGSQSLETVNFAEGSRLEIIGMSAFSGCASLAEITIPASVQYIGYTAFNGCGQWDGFTVNFEEDSQLVIIDSGAFSNSGLIDITIPASVVSIGGDSSEGAFNSCGNLETVTFEEGSQLIQIREMSFFQCSNLTSINLPQGLETIGDSAFHTTGLTEIIIPASVTSIGNQAFDYCNSLTDVTVLAESPPVVTQYGTPMSNPTYATIFPSTNASLIIKVPADSVNDYKTDTYWSKYAGKIIPIEE